MAEARLDCVIVGGGPAGMTAALYLARFRRRFRLLDAGHPRAAWIPVSHNIPFFAEGMPGPEMLDTLRGHLARYGVEAERATVSAIQREQDGFIVMAETPEGDARQIRARRVLLATGAVDIEPDLPGLPDAIQRGLVRYCPICDGFEARGRDIAVIGPGDRGLGEAIFIARTYSQRVTLLTLGRKLDLDPERRAEAEQYGVRIVEDPVEALEMEGDRIAALRAGGEHRFEVLYSALGLRWRSDLALALGAEHDEEGALLVDEHNQTTVPGLYAAGSIVRGLDQIVVGMGHAAIAATHIHNRCELPTEDEPKGEA
ncbi:NAD(P)/FAD-dependent oxidoreductase [Sabulicella rubraurantiaca]|uniref:NAD(P)/FAD-dependent oxidoreductase n=1 Tax=Sabulicella rubraurantiaca TaxID=2811429 RepID=UPI001A97148B|nr:NAD(P)/FAD-dependent oxidoreductase [Sabulicella rubraurantiaca]